MTHFKVLVFAILILQLFGLKYISDRVDQIAVSHGIEVKK